MKELKEHPEYVIALYLAKFSPVSFANLGYDSWTDCFNRCADSLNVKPATIKNLRDAYDAVYPNERKGWYQRPLRPLAADVFSEYDSFTEDSLRSLCIEMIKAHEDQEST